VAIKTLRRSVHYIVAESITILRTSLGTSILLSVMIRDPDNLRCSRVLTHEILRRLLKPSFLRNWVCLTRYSNRSLVSSATLSFGASSLSSGA
jgi:hypothetical protein